MPKNAVLLGLPSFGFCCITSLVAHAHPGHDSHAPQTGLLHYFASPTHVIQIVAIAALAVGAAYFIVRSLLAKRGSESVNLLSSNQE